MSRYDAGAKKYIDSRGWKYKVMGSAFGRGYKARYQKPPNTGPTGWQCVWSLPWRNTREEAQTDLDKLAAFYRWKEWDSEARVIFRPPKAPLV